MDKWINAFHESVFKWIVHLNCSSHVFAQAMCVVPVFCTFVHFRPPTCEQRSSSAPPECFVESAVQEALRREEAALKIRARKQSRNVTRRWARFADGLWKQCEEKAVQEICAEADSRASRITPQLRIVMHREAFNTFISYVFAERSDAAALEHLGIIRDIGGRTVEFWCADEVLEENATMQALHSEALICQSTLEQHQIRLAMAPREPIRLKFKDNLTLECVRRLVHKRFGVAPVKQRLAHRGKTLTRGSLSEQSVGPGSVINVTERTLAKN